MRFFILLAAFFAAVSAVILESTEVEQVEYRSSKKCSLELQAALNYPHTPAADYLIKIAHRFNAAGEVLYTPNNVSYIQNFQQTYGVNIKVFDSFGDMIYPNRRANVAHAYVSVAAADIKNIIVNFSSDKGNYYTQFIVFSPFAEAKYVFITLPSANAPFLGQC